MPRKETRPSGQPRTPRPWLEDLFARHTPSPEQARRIAAARCPKKLTGHDREKWINAHATARAAKAGLAQEDVAALTGWSQTNISRAIIGERASLNMEFVDALSRELRVPKEQIMLGGPQPEILRILGKMAGDQTIRMLPEEERETVELNGYSPLPADMEAYSVATNVLWPRFREGNVLLCRTGSAAIEECLGVDCLVEIGDQLYVGEVRQGAAPGLINLERWREPTLVNEKPTRLSPIEWVYQARTIAPAPNSG